MAEIGGLSFTDSLFAKVWLWYPSYDDSGTFRLGDGLRQLDLAIAVDSFNRLDHTPIMAHLAVSRVSTADCNSSARATVVASAAMRRSGSVFEARTWIQPSGKLSFKPSERLHSASG